MSALGGKFPPVFFTPDRTAREEATQQRGRESNGKRPLKPQFTRDLKYRVSVIGARRRGADERACAGAASAAPNGTAGGRSRQPRSCRSQCNCTPIPFSTRYWVPVVKKMRRRGAQEGVSSRKQEVRPCLLPDASRSASKGLFVHTHTHTPPAPAPRADLPRSTPHAPPPPRLVALGLSVCP
jgi:hypothetical protein